MSIELPEAYILAKQMTQKLTGKEISNCTLKDCQKLQDLGFINLYSSDFDKLIGGMVESVISRGNVIRLKITGGSSLLLAPEYGGKVLFHANSNAVRSKFHLKVAFTDDSAFIVTLTGMGIIQTFPDDEIQTSYVYRRDFSNIASPLDDHFSFDEFQKAIAAKKVNIKTALVGKDAVVVGLGNSIFQDVIYRAGISPKTKASELSESQIHVLYNAIKHVINERIRLGGKDQFFDFYDKQGSYVAAMGSNMKDQLCLACGTEVSRLSLGGGQVYFCPNCQK